MAKCPLYSIGSFASNSLRRRSLLSRDWSGRYCITAVLFRLACMSYISVSDAASVSKCRSHTALQRLYRGP